MMGLERIKNEVKAINELNKTNFALRLILVFNAIFMVMFTYIFMVLGATNIGLLALFGAFMNIIIMVAV